MLNMSGAVDVQLELKVAAVAKLYGLDLHPLGSIIDEAYTNIWIGLSTRDPLCLYPFQKGVIHLPASINMMNIWKEDMY